MTQEITAFQAQCLRLILDIKGDFLVWDPTTVQSRVARALRSEEGAYGMLERNDQLRVLDWVNKWKYPLPNKISLYESIMNQEWDLGLGTE